MSHAFSRKERHFLKSMGVKIAVDPEPEPSAIRDDAKDDTVRTLNRLKIPVTRENYLIVAFTGKIPKDALTKPLPNGLEAHLPPSLRIIESDEGDQ